MSGSGDGAGVAAAAMGVWIGSEEEENGELAVEESRGWIWGGNGPQRLVSKKGGGLIRPATKREE